MRLLLSFTCFFLLIGGEILAQDSLIVTAPINPRDTAWKVGGNIGLQFNQAAYKNWNAGGVNSMAGNGLFFVFANYDYLKWSWKNQLTMAYGLNYQDTSFTKMDDQIDLLSRVDRMISDNWSLSGLINFRTQFADGYDPPGIREDSTKVSGFMAPSYTMAGVGFTYKPNEKFNAFLSPLTLKITTVMDERLSNMAAFGVDSGENVRFEIGGYANISYRTKLATNVDLQSRLGLYSNYLDGNYKYVDVNAELILFMKVNNFITANFAVNLIYDHDIIFDTNQDGTPDGPRTQFKEVLGVGLVYKFGDQLTKK